MFAGDPLTVLEADVYDVPNCCPNGIIKWYSSLPDNCCVDNVAENPYRYVALKPNLAAGGLRINLDILVIGDAAALSSNIGACLW